MTSEKILLAARELFEDKGFDLATVREIASKAGVNAALISYHFGSKEQLLAALIKQMAGLTHVKLADISNSKASPVEKLYQAVELMTDRIFANKKYYQMIHRELSTTQRPEVNQELSKVLKRNRDEIRKIIEEGQQKKVFRKDIDTDLTIGTMFGFIYQTTHAGIKDKITVSENDEAFIARVKKHLCDMMNCFLKKN
jgi:TetR/AcrR family fatty acid metabolism transcriptional regulator